MTPVFQQVNRLYARIAELETELKEAGDYLNRNDRLDERIAALEAENAAIKAAMDNIRDEAQRALGEQFTSPTQAVYKLAHKYSAANARADAATEELEKAKEDFKSDLRKVVEAGLEWERRLIFAEAEAARLREELGYIANAKRRDFPDTEEFMAWAQNRARHAAAPQDAPVLGKEGE